MRVVAVLALLPVLVLLQGCTSWQQRRLTPGETPAVRTDEMVRVLKSNGTVVVLERPHVVGDSLIGEVERSDLRYAVALSDIRRLEQRRMSPLRTAGLTVGIGAGVLAVTAFVALLAIFSAWGGG